MPPALPNGNTPSKLWGDLPHSVLPSPLKKISFFPSIRFVSGYPWVILFLEAVNKTNNSYRGHYYERYQPKTKTPEPDSGSVHAHSKRVRPVQERSHVVVPLQQQLWL
ncbi:hypothetical protein J0A78_01610 [Providencia rettgeri]|uniref:hypothetical protein n=1 Tax=Providencia TaxID=586 RepID=UPI00190515C1|nr:MULTISPECIES: hypothetical protein [Providencia]ELR5188724.1 hypothetical protein [Providencia rettgeri]ELR5206454.1 hypothetical protein [Providencia rettgeri]MBJ9972478.1 hypothetical protein [Providencia rettgeri]MBN7840545.1 hypothetical protein [Providencia rettgeri]MBN7852273.1 hypothetical protein [Providencia rettgeri]